jgi:hypothetical protein
LEVRLEPRKYLLTIQVNFMTKDVPGSWKFDIWLTPEAYYVRTRKSEQDLKNNFGYTWELELAYNTTTLEPLDVALRVVSLTLHEQCPDSQREQLKKILGNYGSPSHISPTDKLVSSIIYRNTKRF